MKKTVLAFVFALFFINISAQPNEVSLVVTGEGATKEEATNNALRSAVEQAFGVFVSANTEILNDELVKDEIATISSGNIKSYVENAYIERQDNIKSVTLTVTVSLSQLVNYTKNHGYSTEFAGSTFAANMRLYELNQQATKTALGNFYRELPQVLSSMYDYKVTVKDPVIKGDNAVLQLNVDVLANQNTKVVGEYFFNTLAALSHPGEELKQLSDMGNSFYGYYFHSFQKTKKDIMGTTHDSMRLQYVQDVDVPLLGKVGTKYLNPDYLYYPIDYRLINNLFLAATYGFKIKSNIDELLDEQIVFVPNDNENSGYDKYRFMAENHEKYYSLSEKQTGLFRPFHKGYHGKDDANVPLLDNAMFMGIIGRNTDYAPGEVLYQLQQAHQYKKEDIYKITSFDITPDFDFGISVTVTWLVMMAEDYICQDSNYRNKKTKEDLLQEAYDLAVITQMSQQLLDEFKDQGLSSPYSQSNAKD